MRVLIARGSAGLGRLLETFAFADPDVAAVTSLAPSSACTVASELSLRYAVQAAEDDLFGKALFWKPNMRVRGSFRIEFLKSRRRTSAPTRGLLKVTLDVNERALDFMCVAFSRDPFEAELQLVAAAHELATLSCATIVAADSGGCDPALLPAVADSWSVAAWHTIALPPERDLAQAARSAFGLPAEKGADEDHARYGRHRKPQLRILHSSHLAVLRASRIAEEGADLTRAALAADLELVASALR